MAPVKNRVKGKQPKVYLGGIFTDGGGFIISVDVWGHPHIKRIPPWEPLVENLAVVSNLLQQARKTKNLETRKQLNTLALHIAEKALPEMRSQARR
jgi:hypothetical protein